MNLDFTETFPHLSRAPIVEAIIDFRAKPKVFCERQKFEAYFKSRLPEYPTILPLHQFSYELRAEVGKQPTAAPTGPGWCGLMFRSKDNIHVAQFRSEGFTFSRLSPYEIWESFEQEALRLWDIYCEMTQPDEIQRIGVRFLNRMSFPAAGLQLSDYLTTPPVTPSSFPLPISGFFHHTTLVVPGFDYQINLVQTVQAAEGSPLVVPIILDIDVFKIMPSDLERKTLREALSRMRWLKNKIFFASVCPTVLNQFK